MNRIEEIVALRREASALSASLRKLCNDLAAGIPRLPSELDRLKVLCDRFQLLRKEQHDEVQRMGLGGVPMGKNLDALLNLEHELEAQRKESRQRDGAHAVLTCMRYLRHRDDAEYAPLEPLRDKAEALAKRLEAVPDDIKDKELRGLLRGKHPYWDLFQLVTRGQQMMVEESAEYLRCTVSVGNAVSPQIAAIAPHKLVIPEDEAKCPALTAETAPTGTPADAAEDLPDEPAEDRAPANLPAAGDETDPNAQSDPRLETADAVVPAEPPLAPLPSEPVLETPEQAPPSTGKVKPHSPEAATQASDGAPEQVVQVAETISSELAASEAPGAKPTPVPAGEPVPPTADTCETEVAVSEPSPNAASRREVAKEQADLLGALRAELWQLVEEDRLGLAAEVARCLRGLGAEGVLPPEVFEISALAVSVRSPIGACAEELGVLNDRLVDTFLATEPDPESGRCAALLTVAPLVRAALLSRASRSLRCLEIFHFDSQISAFRELSGEVQTFRRFGIEIDAPTLRALGSQASWAEAVANFKAELVDWLDKARNKKIIFHHSTLVWLRWIGSEEGLGRLLQELADGREPPVAELQKAAATWSDEGALNARIGKSDEACRGAKARANPIRARGKTSLKVHAREAAEFLRRAVELRENEPPQKSAFIIEKLAELRRALAVKIEQAKTQCTGLIAEGSRAVAAAASVALRRLGPLASVLDADQPGQRELPSQLLLRRELLRIPALRLDTDWRPKAVQPDLLARGILALRGEDWQDNPTGWGRVIEQHCSKGDLLAARRAIEAAEAHGGSEEATAPLHEIFESQLREWRDSLARRKSEVENAIERAVAHFYLEGRERATHLDLVQTLEPDTVFEFTDAFRILTNVKRVLDERQAEKRREIQQLVEERRAAGLGEEILERASAAVEHDNLLAAHELLAQSDSGETVFDEIDPLATFREFFPRFCKTFTEEGRPLGQQLKEIKERKPCYGISFASLPAPQLDSAVRLLQSWVILRKLKPIQRHGRPRSDPGRMRHEVRGVLENLGFRVESISSVPDREVRSARAFDVQCRPLRDRMHCPLPEFGSVAEGRYRVVAVWGRPTVEELLEVEPGTAHSPANIVFYFGRMSEATRRELSEQARASRRPRPLVIDDMLLAFLCGQRGLRLPALFRCALPFGQGFPYTTAAGLVHPEMFFGREHERGEIMKVGGTCLVYGGRQLGKTALLRQVERDHHRPNAGSIVRYIDLKAEGLGTVRPIGEIWQLILAALRSEGVIRQRTPLAPNEIQDKVVEWLEEEQRRRIVFLLDEADEFIEADGRDAEQRSFFHLHQIKDTMAKAQWRFKVVFSGLHNVQRTSRTTNTPLAHLGTPVCIGPLLDRGEVREARRLIVVPFAALGYEFEREDLVTTILARTNYYPSLIQLFCKHLLELLARARFDRRRSPPRIVSDRHIDQAFRSRDLRQAILDRFQWTLDLDARYGFIALLIASESLRDAQEAEDLEQAERATGYSVSRVRERSLELWPHGFAADNSLAAFSTILDEMVGLGVLRRNESSGRYSFRSPNVLKLFGRPKDIEDRLLEAKAREPHPIYQPHTFRRSVESRFVRSPLTALQESQLLKPESGVCLLFGCLASGLRFVKKSLAKPAADQSVYMCDFPSGRGSSVKAFRSWLHRTVEGRHGNLLLSVGPGIQWNERWVDKALELTRTPPSQTIVRVVFLGGPDRAWDWIARRSNEGKDRDALVSMLSLAPWHDAMLRRWLIDNELGTADNPETREKIRSITGLWDHFMDELGRECRESAARWRKALDMINSRLVGGEYVKGFPAVDEAKPLLRILAEYGAADVEELFELADEDSREREQIQRVLGWGELLSWIRREPDGRWSLQPSLVRVFGSGTE